MLEKIQAKRTFFNQLSNFFVPDLEAVNLLEYFLISAVVSLLSIRAFLNLTGFPQVGGENFHIAHMLWGGLLMLIAIIFFASFLNAQSKIIAVIAGGIGFGTFIDELGKFITADNNYFYQPTIAIIYIFFIGIFLLIRFLATYAKYSDETYLINAVEGLKELILADLDTKERNKALQYLRRCDKHDPLVQLLHDVITKAEPNSIRKSLLSKIGQTFFVWYTNAITTRIISKVLTAFFVISATLNIVGSLVLILADHSPTFTELGLFASSLVVGIMALIGLRFYVKNDRLQSYQYFQKATLLAIFLLQFFLFLENELSALFSLSLFVSVYLILQYTIQAETRLKKSAATTK